MTTSSSAFRGARRFLALSLSGVACGASPDGSADGSNSADVVHATPKAGESPLVQGFRTRSGLAWDVYFVSDGKHLGVTAVAHDASGKALYDVQVDLTEETWKVFRNTTLEDAEVDVDTLHAIGADLQEMAEAFGAGDAGVESQSVRLSDYDANLSCAAKMGKGLFKFVGAGLLGVGAAFACTGGQVVVFIGQVACVAAAGGTGYLAGSGYVDVKAAKACVADTLAKSN